jgi:hypothetical protein
VRSAEDTSREPATTDAAEISSTGSTSDAASVEAPGGPKRSVKGPRAVRGPATGFAASLALVVLLGIVIAWTRC